MTYSLYYVVVLRIFACWCLDL